MMAKARYLLRFDDLCPTMDHARGKIFFDLIEKYDLAPILAVVPDNRDPGLECSPADPQFWAKMRLLESRGASIALHGLHHQALQHGRSLVPLHRETEFAGASFEQQQQWIHRGLEILRKNQLKPNLWVAPRHGFDRQTLHALDAEGVQILSDGFARRPFLRGGLTWIPQQLWAPVEKRAGLWTICMHPNTVTDAQVNDLERFLYRHAEQFLSVEQALISFPPKPYGWTEAVAQFCCVQRRRMSHAVRRRYR